MVGFVFGCDLQSHNFCRSLITLLSEYLAEKAPTRNVQNVLMVISVFDVLCAVGKLGTSSTPPKVMNVLSGYHHQRL